MIWAALIWGENEMRWPWKVPSNLNDFMILQKSQRQQTIPKVNSVPHLAARNSHHIKTSIKLLWAGISSHLSLPSPLFHTDFKINFQVHKSCVIKNISQACCATQKGRILISDSSLAGDSLSQHLKEEQGPVWSIYRKWDLLNISLCSYFHNLSILLRFNHLIP